MGSVDRLQFLFELPSGAERAERSTMRSSPPPQPSTALTSRAVTVRRLELRALRHPLRARL